MQVTPKPVPVNDFPVDSDTFSHNSGKKYKRVESSKNTNVEVERSDEEESYSPHKVTVSQNNATALTPATEPHAELRVNARE